MNSKGVPFAAQILSSTGGRESSCKKAAVKANVIATNLGPGNADLLIYRKDILAISGFFLTCSNLQW